MSLTRRDFTRRSAATGAGIALAGSVGSLATAPNALAATDDADVDVLKGKDKGVGYGPLIDDPDGILALPEGFSYKVITYCGKTKLESGEFTPPTTTAPPPSRARAAPRCSSTTTNWRAPAPTGRTRCR